MSESDDRSRFPALISSHIFHHCPSPSPSAHDHNLFPSITIQRKPPHFIICYQFRTHFIHEKRLSSFIKQSASLTTDLRSTPQYGYGSPPTMSSQQPQDTPDPSLKIWSCIICRRRKIRCDRRDPCANCLKSNIDCHYPVTGRVPRRSRDPTAWKSPSQKQSELLSRLRRLETVVTELAAQVEDGSHNPSHTSSTSGAGSTDEQGSISTAVSRDEFGSSKPPTVNTEPGSEFDEEFGRLVIDKEGSLHVGNRFWSVFCSEVRTSHFQITSKY